MKVDRDDVVRECIAVVKGLIEGPPKTSDAALAREMANHNQAYLMAVKALSALLDKPKREATE